VRWDAVEIARFARAGGFQGDEVTTATAVAMATSGGVASYDHHAGAPGAGHWVGLWGIDVDRWPQYAAADLHVPRHAAKAAHELVEETGGWEWAPAAGTSYEQAMRPHAGVSRSQEFHYQQPAAPFTIQHTDRAIRHGIARMAAVRATLANYRSPGSTLWRPTTPSPTNDQ
jgi:hypothetical protein